MANHWTYYITLSVDPAKELIGKRPPWKQPVLPPASARAVLQKVFIPFINHGMPSADYYCCCCLIKALVYVLLRTFMDSFLIR